MAAHLGKRREGKMFETEDTCGRWKGQEQGLGGRKASTDGPFINFFEVVFPWSY